MERYRYVVILSCFLGSAILSSVHAFPSQISKPIGDKVLDSVESLASRVAQSTSTVVGANRKSTSRRTNRGVQGLGGSAFASSDEDDSQVWKALANLERDMQMLDTWTGRKAQLSPLELTMLSLCVLAAGSGPLLLGGHITQFLAPASAAFAASIGIGAEFVGKVAVADGKEVAAASIQCAAEAEGLLAKAERSKAIIPLCVGIGASAASISLLVPVLLDSLNILDNLQLMTEIYAICPLVAVLSAAVAALALQETRSYVQTAISTGNRRFAKKTMVGRTWLSNTELIERKSRGSLKKWQQFALSVLPAPMLGSLVPGAIASKSVVVAALAAAESAYFLAQAEYALARGQDGVALKARSAAVSDTYANQGARSAAILPFTSALASLCAAATAAMVELPLIEALAAAGGPLNTLGEIILVAAFPTGSALFAAAASVSKARCRVDADAATQAASTLALEYSTGKDGDPVMKPFQMVFELMRLSTTYSLIEPLRSRLSKLPGYQVLRNGWKRLLKRFKRNKRENVAAVSVPT